MNPFSNAATFLLQIIIDLYIFVLMLRLILQFQFADYYNPIIQLIIRLTNPVVKPLQRILPSIHRVDLAIIVLILLLEFIELWLAGWLQTREIPNHLGILIWSLGALGNQFLNVFIFATILRALLSWLNPNPLHPASIVLFQITEPLLRFTRRFLPAAGGFDFSPLVVIIVLKVISILLFWPLIQWGSLLTLGPSS